MIDACRLRLAFGGPGLPDATGTLTGEVLALRVASGVQRVMASCPTHWTEVYERRRE